SWGYIETNNIALLASKGEEAYFDFENTQGYLEIDTLGASLYNIDVRGTGTVASAINRSFLVSANRVSLFRCRTSARLSNTTFTGFDGGSYENGQFVGCIARSMTSSVQMTGFNNCRN
ncbi:unnamed protein product, partial [marine sediment metagenome]